MRRLSIADPCAAPWEQMEGAGRDRRCARCDRQVHDLSARTELEATALLLVLGASGLCVRIERDADGVVRHAPAPRRPPPSPRVAAGMMAAAAIGVAACSPAASAPPRDVSVALTPPPPFAMVASEPEPPAAVTPVALVDSDKDGILDAEDACPMEPGNTSADRLKNGCPSMGVVITQGEVVVLERVQFAQGGRAFQVRSQALLDEVANVLRQHPELVKIAIQGHASRDEPGATKLGKARAEAVVAALVKLKVEPGRLVVESYGVERPIADNTTKEGREQNRRVEFKVLEVQTEPPPGLASP